MVYLRVICCAIPTSLWDGPPLSGAMGLIQELISDVFSIERRLRKEFVQEAEAVRFAECNEKLQAAVWQLSKVIKEIDSREFQILLTNNTLPAVRLEGDYFDFLVRANACRPDEVSHPDLRFSSTCYRPEQVPKHLELFRQLAILLQQADTPGIQSRLAFLQQFIVPGKHGFIELLELPSEIGPIRTPNFKARARPVHPIPKFTPPEAHSASNKRGDEAMRDRLASWIDDAIENGTAVNASNQSHVITTEVLSRYLMARENRFDCKIRIVYGDGSEAKPFPLHCLTQSCLAAPQEDAVLRIGLISIRHLEMDHAIDFAWFRNRETSSGGTSAATDEYCYQASMEQLLDLQRTYSGRHVTLRLFHTGLEPAVIGFYRAVVMSLRSNEPKQHWLRVVPTYFLHDENYLEGRPWPT